MALAEAPVNESVEERSLVKKSLDGNIGTITLDNPPKHNALGAPLSGELLLALSDLTNAGARAIVLRAYKEALSFVAEGRVKAIIETQPLESINDVFQRQSVRCGRWGEHIGTMAEIRPPLAVDGHQAMLL